MSLPCKLLYELERKGAENDFATENKQEKYLNISRETGEFLLLFLKAVRAKKVLEFGTSNGYSTIWLALGLPNDGRLVTIENSYAKIQEAKKNFEAASVTDKISILEINFEDYLKKTNDTFDFIFLDGDRSLYYPNVNYILRLLSPGGVIICDNAISHKSELMHFMYYFTNQESFSTTLLPIGKGEYVVYKPS